MLRSRSRPSRRILEGAAQTQTVGSGQNVLGEPGKELMEGNVRQALSRLGLPISLLVVWAGAGTAQSESTSIFQGPDNLWVIDGLTVPAIADTFALIEVNRYHLVELGIGLVYSSPLQNNLNLTIYAYPPPQDVEDPVLAELTQAVEDIQGYAATRRPPWSVTMKNDGAPFSQPLDDGAVLDGYAAEAEFVRSGRTSRTFAYVFEKAGRILKYRITYDEDARSDLWEYLDRWMLETASTIQSYQPR